MTLSLLVVVACALAWARPGGPPARAAFRGANGRLAYEHEAPAGDHTQADIFTVLPDGTARRRLTTTPNQNEFGPAWNAAGNGLAFWRTPAPFGPGSIWVMFPDGSHQRRLTSGIDARDPAWSPDGKRIVFTLVSGAGFDLWTMRASDGGDRRRLTSGPALDFEPAWSPDGRRIAYTRGFEQGDTGDIWVVDVATGKAARVRHSAEYDHQVAWSPAGDRLVFERDEPRSSSIYSVQVDGSDLRRLTSGVFFDVGPAYSPNGRLIAFGSDRGGGLLHDLWLMTADGTNQRRLRRMQFSEGFPDWQARPGG